MKLTAVISFLAGMMGLILSSCAKEFTNTFATSVSTSGCRDYLHVQNYRPEWTTFDMNISGGKAECLVHSIGVSCGFDEVVVKLSTGEHLVKVILEYNYTADADCGDCFHNVAFTLDDLPEENFVFELYSEYNHNVFGYSYDWKYKNPHVRTMISKNDPENSNLVLRFDRNPD